MTAKSWSSATGPTFARSSPLSTNCRTGSRRRQCSSRHAFAIPFRQVQTVSQDRRRQVEGARVGKAFDHGLAVGGLAVLLVGSGLRDVDVDAGVVLLGDVDGAFE